GAQAEDADRWPTQFGPTEVSSRQPLGRMDVTAVVSDTTYGSTLGQRLRNLADCGFLIRKWETYDEHYFNDIQEGGPATGGRGIRHKAPNRSGTSPEGPAPPSEDPEFPPPANIADLARRAADGNGGKPTCVMPSDGEVRALAASQEFA